MEATNDLISSGLILDERYKLLRPLSSDGGSADVWLALDINTIDEVVNDDDEIINPEESGIKVAIKIYRPKNAMDIGEQRFREEFKIVFNCHHQNLIQPINFSIYKGIPYLVLPYCEKGSSESLQGKINSPDELWRYIADVSAGLAHLHSYEPTIVHHDIKPANVLIDDNNNYAITDFGISSRSGWNRDGYDNTASGTLAYMAPERFSDDYQSIAESDIWSLGATLYEIVTGKAPYGEGGGRTQAENGNTCSPITQPIPKDIKKLISDCMNPDPKKRPSAALINKAAISRRYPLKPSKGIYMWAAIVVAVMLVLAVVLIISLLSKKPEPAPDPVPVEVPLTMDERFANAMPLVNSANKNDLALGLSMLDSLSALDYVPATYELALTYGWYPDEASVSRKDLLDIEYYTKGDKKYLPKDKQINIKAIGYLTKIEEMRNAEYPEINAQTLYRIAIYYTNPNDLIQKDVKRATKLLDEALEWAQQTDNEELKEKLKRNIKVLKDHK